MLPLLAAQSGGAMTYALAYILVAYILGVWAGHRLHDRSDDR